MRITLTDEQIKALKAVASGSVLLPDASTKAVYVMGRHPTVRPTAVAALKRDRLVYRHSGGRHSPVTYRKAVLTRLGRTVMAHLSAD